MALLSSSGIVPASVCLRWRRLAMAFAVPGCLTIAASVGPAAEAPPVGAGETPRDYVIFIGLDIAVPIGGQHLRIDEFSNRNAWVRAGGIERTIPVSQLREMRFLREPKVSRLTATVTEPRAEPTHRSDKAVEEALATQMDLFDLATAENNSARFELGQAQLLQGTNPEAVAAATAKVIETEQRGDERNLALMDFRDRKLQDAMEGGFDAVQASFQLSAPEPVAEAYAILLFEMELPGERGVPRQTVRMSRVTDLGVKPKRVRVFATGFPTGFTLTAFKVYVYAGTVELATNLSDNRLDVTRDEAAQFMVMQYQLAHARDTLAPAPLRALADARARAAIAPSELAREVTLVISAAGAPTQFFAGNDRTHELDGALRRALETARFYPALSAGQPVESSYTGTLDEIL